MLFLLLVFCGHMSFMSPLPDEDDLPEPSSLAFLSPEKARRYAAHGRQDWDLRGLRSISDETLKVIAERAKSVNLDGLSDVTEEQLLLLTRVESLSLNGLRSLGKKKAQYLGRIKESVSLNGLTELGIEELVWFKDTPRKLSLGGLPRLSLEQIRYLGRERGTTQLDNWTEIPDPMLRALVDQDSGEWALNGIRELDEDQARILAQAKCHLELGGIRLLTDRQLKILIKANHPITFPNVHELSPQQEDIIIRHPGEPRLKFPGLRSLSPAMAKHLVKNERMHLTFREPVLFSNATARELVQFSGWAISFPGQKSLTPEQAAILATSPKPLRLDGLESISPEVAWALAKHRGELTLNGMVRMSPDVAEALGQQKGYLELDGLTELSPAVAKGLSKQVGTLTIKGVTRLSDSTAMALASHQGKIVFANLRTLTDSQARSLCGLKSTGNSAKENTAQASSASRRSVATVSKKDSDEEANLVLGGLVTLTDDQARSFGQSNRSIDFPNLNDLSASQARNLIQGTAHFTFSALPEISDELALIFSRHQGKLTFDKLKRLTERQADILINYQGKTLGFLVFKTVDIKIIEKLKQKSNIFITNIYE